MRHDGFVLTAEFSELTDFELGRLIANGLIEIAHRHGNSVEQEIRYCLEGLLRVQGKRGDALEH